ncbi:hypothetical protein TSUD_65040 [Trifolium subterraneum]|uniref:F-box domain-containing protein n=1 Tax=Trifolium subterraneum TaxID=3900 RepID=A0A2Z6NCU0_TRISU|nr:hypothetical protein TSUD_65040 [Trifolium subterraneum]
MPDKNEMRGMSNFLEESVIREKINRRRPNEDDRYKENGENVDRLSDLPDDVLLHVLSFLNTQHVVQTCVLSTRWKYLWKLIPTLILHSSSFSTKKHFARFLSKILTLRDSLAKLHTLDFVHHGDIESRLLKKILSGVSSHNTHLQKIGINVRVDTCIILSCVSSCRALTSLKLSLYPKSCYNFSETLFPNSLNFPELTSLDLTNFVFCGGGNGCVAPFLAFNKLNSLIIHRCTVRDAQILHISSETLVNLTMHDNSFNIGKIELSTPNLHIFTFRGIPGQLMYGSGLSSVKLVSIDALMYSNDRIPPLVLFTWLLEFANLKSLTVSSTTLQVLSLIPDLLEVEHLSLCNLKSMEIKLQSSYLLGLSDVLKEAMVKKVAAKSRKEATKLRKAFDKGLQPPFIPDGIVDFLLQNSPSAKVNITTIY